MTHPLMHVSGGGERESMELPGRTQGNPDASLWAADVAHFVRRPVGGGGRCGDRNKGVRLTKRACVE